MSKAGQVCLRAANTFWTRASGRSLSEHLTSFHISGSLDRFCKLPAKVRAHIADREGMCSGAECRVRTENVEVDGAVCWDCGVGMSSSARAVSALRRFGGGPRVLRERFRSLILSTCGMCNNENKGERTAFRFRGSPGGMSLVAQFQPSSLWHRHSQRQPSAQVSNRSARHTPGGNRATALGVLLSCPTIYVGVCGYRWLCEMVPPPHASYDLLHSCYLRILSFNGLYMASSGASGARDRFV